MRLADETLLEMMIGNSLFAHLRDSRRRQRSMHARLGRAFALATVENLVTRVSVVGNATRTVSGLSNSIVGGVDIQKSKTWTLGTAVDTVSQILTTTLSIAASATNNFDLVASLTNVVGDSSATLTGIKFILVELLTSSQHASGTACTSITIGNHGSAAWVAPFGATGTYTIKSGGWWAHEDPTAAGVAITATTADLLKIVNDDATNAAFVRITVLGIP